MSDGKRFSKFEDTGSELKNRTINRENGIIKKAGTNRSPAQCTRYRSEKLVHV